MPRDEDRRGANADKATREAATCKASRSPEKPNDTSLPPCHFLEIPPELRLEIYEHVFGEPYEVCLTIVDNLFFETGEDNPESAGYRNRAALLLSCKTIYLEARKSFAESVTYRLDVEDGDSPLLAEDYVCVDLGPLRANAVLPALRETRLRFWAPDSNASRFFRRLHETIRVLNACTDALYLTIDLDTGDALRYFDPLCKALQTLRCANPVNIVFHRRNIRIWGEDPVKVNELAQLIGGNLVEKGEGVGGPGHQAAA